MNPITFIRLIETFLFQTDFHEEAWSIILTVSFALNPNGCLRPRLFLFCITNKSYNYGGKTPKILGNVIAFYCCL
ncbi:hypothetical protein QTP70_030216 [Hemibagrus guttatus]|uniref:Uncharacterized protein n=1 Tax=Hemibagrus guttatus TaxID=175788 RepID=A0AAE0REM7_9TELE|nr:hypothetical protein QTP70_030216 [Hemibagrus guttatus]